MIHTGAPVFTPLFSPYQAPATASLKVRSEVVFGTPSKNCSGNGICMLTQHRMSGSLSGPCPKAQCWLQLNPARQEAILEFDRNELSEQILEKYFATTHFYMEEAVNIPLSLSKHWKPGGRISFFSGCYPAIQHRDKIVLVLQYGLVNLH